MANEDAGLKWNHPEEGAETDGLPEVLRLYKNDRHVATILKNKEDGGFLSHIPDGIFDYGYSCVDFLKLKDAKRMMEEFALTDPKKLEAQYLKGSSEEGRLFYVARKKWEEEKGKGRER